MEKENMRCVIVGASKENDIEYINDVIRGTDYIIGVDAGISKLNYLNIIPDLIVGDFDSFKGVAPKTIETKKLNIHKDDTDMFCAVKEGINRGYSSFVILGGVGGRLDHTYANLCVLEYLSDNGYENLLLGKKDKAFIMNKGKKTILGRDGDNISIFPFGTDLCTVTYNGLLYDMQNETLYSNLKYGPMGVSNSFLNNEAEVILHKGKALVVISSD